MRRLYLQVYLVIVGILGLFGLLVLGAWLLAPPSPQDQPFLDGGASPVADRLPPARSAPEQEAALARLGRSFHLRLTLWSAEGQVLAQQGERLPFPGSRQQSSGWMRARGGPVGILHLPDGRWLVLRHPHSV